MASSSNTAILPRPLRRFSWGTGLVALLCLGNAGISFWLFLQELIATDASHTGPGLAVVEGLHAEGRRKAAQSFFWSPLRRGETLFRHDAIQSGPQAGIRLRLRNGTGIEMGENSLILVDDAAELSLRFLRGDFILHDSAEDSRISVDKSGGLHRTPIPLRALLPASHTTIFVPPSHVAQVRFTWEPPSHHPLTPEASAITTLVLELADEPHFSSAHTRQLRVPAAKDGELALPVKVGHYYWRLSSGKSPLTESRVLRVVEAPALVAIAPSENSLAIPLGSRVADFRWMVGSSATGPSPDADWADVPAALEISETPDFARLVRSVPVTLESGHAVLTDPLKHSAPGRLYWRLKASFPDFEQSSPALAFAITDNPKLSLNLLQPAPGSVVTIQNPIHFSWRLDDQNETGGPAGGIGFSLQIARKSSASPATSPASASEEQSMQQTTSAQVFDWNAAVPGTYRWRVAVIREGNLTETSQWRELSVSPGKPLILTRPLPGQTFHYWDHGSPVTLSWEPDPLATDNPGNVYQVDLSLNPDFRDAEVLGPTRETQLSTSRPPSDGTHFWRVRLVDRTAEILRLSQPRTFEYRQHPLLGPPGSAEPEMNTVFKKMSRDSAPAFHWSEVTEARGYEITIRRGEKTLIETAIHENAFSAPPLEVGRYQWSIRAIDPLGRPGARLPWRELSIDYGDPLAPPEITKSEVK